MDCVSAAPATATRVDPLDAGGATPRFRERREAILDAAARQFNRLGIDGGTLADVARSVGLVTNSITYYYRRKEDLVSACLLRAIEAMNRLVAQAAAQPGVEARVRRLVDGHVAMLADIARERHPELVQFSETRALTAPHDEAVFRAYTDMFRGLRELLKDEDGAPLPREDLNARAHLLLSLLCWTREWIDRYEPEDYARAGNWIADILLHGLAAPQARWHEQEIVPRAAAAAGGTATPEAFLRAASRLVNRHGYRGASVDRISAELALTKGSFYHHHPTKDDLICACLDRTFGVIRDVQAAAAGHDGSGWERLVLAARSLLRFQLSDDGPLLRVSAWSALPPALRGEKLRTMNRASERFAGFVVDGMRDGSLRIVDPGVAAQLVTGMINAAAELESWVPGVAIDNASDLYARPLLEGLLHCPPAGAPDLQTPLFRPQPHYAAP